MKHLEYRFTLGDQAWTLDIGPLTVDDYIELKKVTGYNVARLLAEFDDMNPLVLKAMVWLARRKSGEDIAWEDPEMSFTMADLQIKKLRDDTAPNADEEAQTNQGAGPVPTKARPARAPRTRTSKTK